MKRLCLSLLFVLSVKPAVSQDSFFPVAIDQDALGGAPDFSFLNHPLGPADRLVVNGGHFCRAGSAIIARKRAKARRAKARSGSPIDVCDRIRLFGVNLAFVGSDPDRGAAG